MNTLETIQNNLPSKLEDLAKFVLVGREKLTAVRANIRAIDKLELAEDVREQKKEEAQMLAEALLDAEVRIGDLLKQIPKTSGGDRKSNNFKNDTDVDFEKQETKKEAIEKLGFNQKQAERFETLSSNKDVVEQVKAEARENDDIPTRTRVLQLVKQKTQEEQFIEQGFKDIEAKKAIEINYHNALFKILTLDIKDEEAQIWISAMSIEEKERLEEDIDCAIQKLEKIKKIYKDFKKIRRLK